MSMILVAPETRRESERRTGRAVLLALIDGILVLAGRRRFEALAIDEVKVRKVRDYSIGADHSMWVGTVEQGRRKVWDRNQGSRPVVGSQTTEPTRSMASWKVSVPSFMSFWSFKRQVAIELG
jgi:hypothetical protein